MKALLEIIVKALVDNPENVNIVETVKEDSSVLLQINVDKNDIGKIIGRQGRTAKCIRTLMKASAVKYNKKVSVDIV